MRTAWNNGFDHIVAAGCPENVHVMIKLVMGTLGDQKHFLL